MVEPVFADVSAPVMEAVRISKNYGSVRALRGVTMSLGSGEVVGLVGDNGAGKSTLVKILSGVLPPTDGEIYLDGRPALFGSPLEARLSGIETVYQDLALALDLPIYANIFLGREIRVRGPMRVFGSIDRKRMSAEARDELRSIGIDLGDMQVPCRRLSGGQRQAVAVARAVAWGTRVVLMDEPTAALAIEEQRKVERLMYHMRDRGTPVLLVSHNLPEVHRMCDRIVVLRHGQVVADVTPSTASVQDIVMWITGAAVGNVESEEE